MSHPYTKSCADFFIILCRMIVSLTIEGSDQLVILSPCCCGNNNKGRTINKTEIFRTQTAGYLKSSTCNLTFKAWRIADNSIPSARTVVDFLFKVQDKIFC
jgi:hypothetical protein